MSVDIDEMCDRSPCETRAVCIAASACQAKTRHRLAAKGFCPNCGTSLETGFGLAGGGYGVYSYCPSEKCGEYFHKTQMKE